MIRSIWQIDLTNAGGTHRLLDYGDDLSEEIRWTRTQGASRYAPINAAWGETSAERAALMQAGWERTQTHASHAIARSYCLRHAATTAPDATGTLTISVQGGEVWQIEDCTLLSSAPMPMVANGIRTLTAYQAIGGRMSPVAAITLYAGIPWDFILQNWETIAADWEDL